jgi:hypothetical protein
MHKQELVCSLQGGPGRNPGAGEQNSSVCHLFEQLRIRHRKDRRRVHHDEIEFGSPFFHEGTHPGRTQEVSRIGRGWSRGQKVEIGIVWCSKDAGRRVPVRQQDTQAILSP